MKGKKRFFKVSCIILSFIIIIGNITFTNSFATNINQNVKAPIELSKEVDKNEVLVGDEFTINYSIQPDPIPLDDVISDTYSKDKEIVLVMDSSGSMAWGLDGETDVSNANKRMTIAKNAAKLFVDSFDENEKVSIGLIDYDTKAHIERVDGNILVNKDKFANLKNRIEHGLKAKGATNIGDGLRRAYWILKESDQSDSKKYIILMTDGQPTALSYTSTYGAWQYKLDNGNVSNNNIINYGSNDPYGYALEYAKTVASQKISSEDPHIDTFIIGFSNDINKDKLQQIADSSNGFYKEAASAEDINEVYEQLADEIQSDLPIHSINFQETFPSGINVIRAAEGLEINEQTVSGDIGSITYTLNEETKHFEAEPIQFSITLSASIVGEYRLSTSNNDNTSYIDYKDIDGTQVRKFFDEKNINVRDILPAPILSADPTTPTDGNVTVSITYPVEAVTKEYKIDAGDWQEYTNEIVLDKNATVYAQYSNEAGEQSEIGSLVVDNIIRYLRVLEVQPGTQYELNDSYFDSEYHVELVQMPMSGFIGQIDEINGKYDIVYIGNNTYSDNVNKHHYNINSIDGRSQKTIKYSAKGEKPNRINGETMKVPQGGLNGNDSVEYYSPNDITNRRAAILKSFVESGQLTIFSSDIFSNELSNTRLYENFIEYKDNNSFPHFKTIANINKEEIMTGYINANKRVKLTLNIQPTEYTETQTYQDDTMMSFGFDVNSKNDPDLMKATLYIDINGDGIFRDNEALSMTETINNGEGYSINYRVPESFTGLQPWKLEVEEIETGVKSYRTGYTAFKGNPLHVRVLQLYPNGNTLNLATDMKVPLIKAGEYEIEITPMKYRDFNDNPPNLNGNYDMVVIGFADIYGGNDISDSNAIETLKNFIETGQGVMFTHDTVTFRTKDTNGWAYNLTKEFRDLIGQNIYIKDAFDLTKNPSHENRLPLPNESKKSYGFTRFALDRANNGNGFKTSNVAYKLNEGLITSYPYVLKEELPVKTTHYQYLQLDLEDEDVIPWYTLQGDGYNKWDGRNDYYTYTKGNITYSGTGHQKPDGIDEHKLFINTMIKAIRGANHAPTLEVYDISDDQNIPKSKETLDISFRATDIDLTDRLLDADIYVDSNGDDTFSEDEKVRSFTGEEKIESGIRVNTNVPLNISEGIVRFGVMVKVYDIHDAQAAEEVVLNYVATPTLSLGSNLADGYLIGDTVDLNLNVNAENIGFDTIIENIGLDLTIDSSSFDVSNSDQWVENSNKYTIEIENLVVSDGDPSWTSITKGLTLNLKNEGEFSIPALLGFEVSDNLITNVSGSTNSNLSVNVRSGKIDVEVVDEKGRAIKDIDITISKDASEVGKGETNNTGLYSLTGLSSGQYEVSIDTPENYVLEGENSRIVNLSYGNNVDKVRFVFSGDCISNLEITTIDGEDKTNIIENGKLLGKVSINVIRDIETLNVNLFSDDISEFSVEKIEIRKDGSSYEGDWSITDNDLASNRKTIDFPTNLEKGRYECILQIKIPKDSLDEGQSGYIKIDSAIVKEPYFEDGVTDTYNQDPNPSLKVTIVEDPSIL